MPRRVSLPQQRNKFKSFFAAAQGELAEGQERVAWAMYVAKNTSQAASVGFFTLGTEKSCAQRSASFSQKSGKPLF